MAMPGSIRVLFADWGRRGRPNGPTFFIAQVDDLALRIGNGIVAPRRQPVGLAVAGPGESQTAFGDQGSKLGPSDYVRPRSRCNRARFQIDGILAAVGSEAADAIKIRQLQERKRPRRFFQGRSSGKECRRCGELRGRGQLLLKRTAAAVKHCARDGQDLVPIPLRQRQPIAQEDTAGTFFPGLQGMRLYQTFQDLAKRTIIGGVFLVGNHQIGLEAAGAPVRVGQKQLANQREIALFPDQYRENGKIAGNSMRPEILLAQAIPQQTIIGWPKPGIRIKKMTGKFLETLRGGSANSQITEFQLGARPSHFESAADGFTPRVLFDQCQQIGTGARGQSDEGKLNLLPGIQGKTAAQAEDGIDYRSGCAGQITFQSVRRRDAIASSQKALAISLKLDWTGRTNQ